MKLLKNSNLLYGIFAWILCLIYAFPILWLLLTSFKTELQAISVPPLFVFEPTFENFLIVDERSDYTQYALNSVITSLGSTALALLIGIPAAFVFAFHRRKKSYKQIILWMLSTKMMPAVGVLIPIYILFRDMGLLDTRFGLTIVLMLCNLPIIIWMLYSYFREIPYQILEAARVDGVNALGEIFYIILPLGKSGIASTALLGIILAWNEAFWSINLTAADAGNLVALIASYSSPEGLFWAKLSAASVMAVLPIAVMGWFSQKQLVQGLSFGAVK